MIFLISLGAAAAGIGAAMLIAAGFLASTGRDVWWLPILGAATFAVGLPSVVSLPPDAEARLRGQVFPRFTSSRGAGLVLMGVTFAYLAGFLGFVRLGLAPPCQDPTSCTPPLILGASGDAVFAVLLVGVAIAIVSIGLGVSQDAGGEWGRLFTGGGVVAPIVAFAGLPRALGLFLLGLIFTGVAYLAWRHRGTAG